MRPDDGGPQEVDFESAQGGPGGATDRSPRRALPERTVPDRSTLPAGPPPRAERSGDTGPRRVVFGGGTERLGIRTPETGGE